jgi:hypothetical protein
VSSLMRNGETQSAMARNLCKQLIILRFPILLLGIALPQAWAASCMTQAQMPAPERDALVSAAKSLASEVQAGNIAAIRSSTLPAIAADFNGIQQTVQYLQPIVQQATITIDNLYLLDASTDPPNQPQTDFYCGSPVVGFDFNGIPPGTYGLVIIHATGVKQPQQIVLILSKTQDNRRLLAGFFVKPMLLDGHDGTWYWASARKYAQSNGEWSASIYYRIAGNLLNPVDFLASPNLEKLRHEADQLHSTLPAASSPLSVNAGGASYKVTAIDTTTEFGALDLDVHYVPDASQMADLRTPAVARKQVTDLMNALLGMHPELARAFHGMWLHADQGNASLFALELPMSSGSDTPRPVRPQYVPVPR